MKNKLRYIFIVGLMGTFLNYAAEIPDEASYKINTTNTASIAIRDGDQQQIERKVIFAKDNLAVDSRMYIVQLLSIGVFPWIVVVYSVYQLSATARFLEHARNAVGDAQAFLANLHRRDAGNGN